jgi:hypothetical protein
VPVMRICDQAMTLRDPKQTKPPATPPGNASNSSWVVYRKRFHRRGAKAAEYFYGRH